MINKNNVRIGSDFEHFLENKKGELVSAIPFNTGTKANPEPLSREGCCIQRDGVLQECNVPPVFLDQSTLFWENIEFVRAYLRQKFEPLGLTLKCCASGVLPKEEMKSKEARQLGCDPDFNAWENGNVNQKKPLKNRYFRTCGCHFHMSYSEADPDISLELVKLFDLHLTVPFILIDTDRERRKLYGQAGSFRLQDWGDAQGVEFRQLSNKVLESQELIEYAFNQLDMMIDHFNDKGMGSIDHAKDDIVKCINTSDEKLARQILTRFNIPIIIEKVKDNELSLETV